jgi:hypothetical protein
MIKYCFSFLLVAILLTACATLPAEAPPVGETPSPQPSSAPPKSELPTEAVIVYSRNGGIAGLDEVWTIYPDGSVSHAVHPQGEGPEKQYQVPADEAANLLAQLQALGFFELTGSYMPLDTCCDRITYGIEARSGEQTNRVVTLDGAPQTPPELWQAIDLLNAFIAQFQQ